MAGTAMPLETRSGLSGTGVPPVKVQLIFHGRDGHATGNSVSFERYCGCPGNSSGLAVEPLSYCVK